MESRERNEFMKLLNPIWDERFVIGYDQEIHKDDALKVNITLPLVALKRLMSSYLNTITDILEDWVYLGSTGSTESRLEPYCHLMLNELVEAISVNGQDGEAVYNEIFDAEFKARHDKMDLYAKAHANGQCVDPKCYCHELMGDKAEDTGSDSEKDS